MKTLRYQVHKLCWIACQMAQNHGRLFWKIRLHGVTQKMFYIKPIKTNFCSDKKTSKTEPVNPKERDKIWTHYVWKPHWKLRPFWCIWNFFYKNFCPLSRGNNSHCRVCGTQQWLQSPMYRSVQLPNASAWPGQTSQSITDIPISTLTIGLSSKLNYKC